MSIPWEAVTSSAVQATAWDDETMYVRYSSGDEYAYDGISFGDYEGIKNASSIGRELRTVGVRGRRV